MTEFAWTNLKLRIPDAFDVQYPYTYDKHVCVGPFLLLLHHV